MEKVKKKDFVEIQFIGKHDGKVFDTNIPEELKKLNPDAKAKKLIICAGQGMLIKGLDEALEGKEIGEIYNIHILYKDGFGPRNRELVKTIPLNVFTKQKINPRPGETLFMDNMVARVITISGARVITDFNNPLAGKDLDYEFKIIRIVKEEKEKCEAFFEFFFKFIPEFEISEKITVKGEKKIENFVKIHEEKFKELIGKGLEFKLEENKKEKEESEKQDKQNLSQQSL